LRIDRVKGRRKDASDADAEVLRKQLAFDVGEIDWWRVDASGTPPHILADICAALGLPEPSEHRS